MILRLAARNLTRNLRRTALSTTAVVAGVAVLIVGQGAIGGFEEIIVHGQVDALSGHVAIRPPDWPTTPLQLPLEGWFDPAPALAAAGPYGAATARTEFNPMLVHAADALRVRAIGFDPATDAAVFPRDGWTVDGRVPGADEDAVLVGEGVARVLGIGPGDRVVLKSRTPAGAINALDVEVAGRLKLGNPAIDRFGVLVPAALVAKLEATPNVTQVHVRLRDRDDAEAVAADLRAALPGLDPRPWRVEAHDMLDSQKIRQAALQTLVTMLLLMAATTIANTVLMAAYERVREIGTLRALGMTRRTVVRLFLVEGALMGVAGGLVGATVGGAVVLRMATTGVDLSGALDKAAMTMPITTVLYFSWSPPTIAFAFAFGVVVSVLASIYPAWVASKLEPADAIRA